MNNGTCPKCNSTKVYRGSATEGEGLTAGSYPAIVELITGKSQTTLWIDTYICKVCGYTEMYVANRQSLVALPEADGWEKVEPDTGAQSENLDADQPHLNKEV